MGWLVLLLILASQQDIGPPRLPAPPDPTAQMWVGLGMGVAVAIMLASTAWRVGSRVGERLLGKPDPRS